MRNILLETSFENMYSDQNLKTQIIDNWICSCTWTTKT